MKRFSIIGRKLVVEQAPPGGFTPADKVPTVAENPVAVAHAPAAVAVSQDDFTGGPGITLEFNPIKEFWEIAFPGRPCEALRLELKAARWRYWGPTKVWWNKGTPENKAFAEAFIARHGTAAEIRDPKSVPATTAAPVEFNVPVKNIGAEHVLVNPVALNQNVVPAEKLNQAAAPVAPVPVAVRQDRKYPPGFTRAADRQRTVAPVAMVALTQ